MSSELSVARPTSPLLAAFIRVTRWLHLVLLNHGINRPERQDRQHECDAIAEAWIEEHGASWGLCAWHLRSSAVRLRQRVAPGGEPTSLSTGFALLVALGGQVRLALHDPEGRVSGSPWVAGAFCASLGIVAVVLVAFPSDRQRLAYGMCSSGFSVAALVQAKFYRDPDLAINMTKKCGLLALALGMAGISVWSLLRGGLHQRLFVASITTAALAGYVIAVSACLSMLAYRADPVAPVANLLLAYGTLAAAATAPRLRGIPPAPV